MQTPASVNLVKALSYSFPAGAVMMAAYVTIIDKAFALAELMGSHAGSKTIALLRFAYTASNCCLYTAAHFILVYSCYTDEPFCSSRPFDNNSCLIAAPSIMLIVFAQLWIERAVVPFLQIQNSRAYRRGAKGRISNAGVVCVVWMGLAHTDPVSLVLISLVCATRALHPLKALSFAYTTAFKTAVWLICFKALSGTCSAVSATMAVSGCLSATLI